MKDDFNCNKAKATLMMIVSGEKSDIASRCMTRVHMQSCKECHAYYLSLCKELDVMSIDIFSKDLIIDPKETIDCNLVKQNIESFASGALGIINSELVKKIEIHMLVCDNCAEVYGKILDEEFVKSGMKIPPCPDINPYIEKRLEEDKRRKNRNTN